MLVIRPSPSWPAGRPRMEDCRILNLFGFLCLVFLGLLQLLVLMPMLAHATVPGSASRAMDYSPGTYGSVFQTGDYRNLC